MNKVISFVFIISCAVTLFASDFKTISKWQFANEDSLKKKFFFYDSIGNLDNHKSKFSIYAKEFVYALGGSACCLGTGIAAGILFIPAMAIDQPSASFDQAVIAVLGLSIILNSTVTAWGTCKAAKEIDPGGSFGISCLGSTGGSILGDGIGYEAGVLLFDAFGNHAVSYISGITIYLFCNSIGAIIGYNLSLPKGEGGYGFLNRHFDLPSFIMKTEKTQEGKIITAFDFRLINTRF